MTQQLSDATIANNERLLDKIESLGGGYLWDAEVFAVTLMEVAVGDPEATLLCDLVGVQQVAIDASRLSLPILERIARIPGLQSLVLKNLALSESGVSALSRFVPEVLVVDE